MQILLTLAHPTSKAHPIQGRSMRGLTTLSLQNNLSTEEQLQEGVGKKLHPSHRAWNSFATNTPTESPSIGAHYTHSGLTRGNSVDQGAAEEASKALHHNLQRTRWAISGFCTLKTLCLLKKIVDYCP